MVISAPKAQRETCRWSCWQCEATAACQVQVVVPGMQDCSPVAWSAEQSMPRRGNLNTSRREKLCRNLERLGDLTQALAFDSGSVNGLAVQF
jgi:hypothetical protein